MNINKKMLMFILICQMLINLVFCYHFMVQSQLILDITHVLDSQDELNTEFYHLLIPSPPAMSQPTEGEGV